MMHPADLIKIDIKASGCSYRTTIPVKKDP
jgi:hypothetical protein